jgi:hypothetical protein
VGINALLVYAIFSAFKTDWFAFTKLCGAALRLFITDALAESIAVLLDDLLVQLRAVSRSPRLGLGIELVEAKAVQNRDFYA